MLLSTHFMKKGTPPRSLSCPMPYILPGILLCLKKLFKHQLQESYNNYNNSKYNSRKVAYCPTHYPAQYYTLKYRVQNNSFSHIYHFAYKGNKQVINFSINYSENKTIINDYITSEYHGCQGFLIDSLHPVEVFEQIEKQIRLSIVRFNFRRYLFIIRNDEKDIKIAFKTDALTHVADVLIINPRNSDTFELWTHNFVASENMNELKLLDIFFAENKSFLFETNLYPDKLKNFEGRVLKITCFNYAPYASCDPNLPQDKLYGSELRAALEFIDQYNMTMKLVYNEIEEEYWGELFSNWSGTGLMGNILTDKADIGFFHVRAFSAAFYTWGFVNTYLDISEPFIRTGITCLVPKPRMTSAWLTPLLSYSNPLWAAVLSNFLYNAVIFSLIAFYYEKSTHSRRSRTDIAYNTIRNSFWALLKISLSQGLTKTVNNGHLPVRIILVIFLLMYSILDSTYFSGLASIMTIPRFEQPINTVSDLAQENVNIFAISDAWIFSIEKAEDEEYVKILSNFHIASDEQRELSKQENNAFFIERLPFNNYAINDYIKEDVIENYHLMEEDVYWEYTRFFLRKSSVFTQIFDVFLLHLMENGIASRWQQEAVYHFMDFNVQRITFLKDSKKIVARAVVKLNLFHVQGAFALLIIGYSLSFIVFLIEKCFRLFHKK
ncbi:hypothetical protein WA026_018297 [Henosepilachna vigintioctopunctata]|uniref:Ionotropic glutamate receptor C-terminal domain-containing protein n=1 Tax=Henosepilachna vigintioctopunctata TaxID=420089 RepID=A0AAW1VE33_9CUCU